MSKNSTFCTGNDMFRSQYSSDQGYPKYEYGNRQARYYNNHDASGLCNMAFTSGKWYWEYIVKAGGNSNGMIISMGIADGNIYVKNNTGGGDGTLTGEIGLDSRDGEVRKDNSVTKTYSELSGKIQNGNIVGVAVDADNGAIYYSLNGTFMGSGDPTSGASKTNAGATWTPSGQTWYPTVSVLGGTQPILIMNFGQDSTFMGETTAGSSDDGTFGSFKYSVPADYKAVCTGNMPTSTDIDPAATDDDIPGKQLTCFAYTGNGGSQSITGFNFKPDFLFFKSFDQVHDWNVFDSTRGVQKYLVPNDTDNETTDSNSVTSFDTDGFTTGSSSRINTNSALYQVFACKANGGTTSSNGTGDITSTVQANTKAGFSIVKWTSNNSSNQTIGHGLTKAPKLIISKPYTTGNWSWHVFIHYLGSVGNWTLNESSGGFTSSTNTYGAMPTSDVFTVGAPGNLMPNNSTTDVVSYCWHDVDGLQKFSTYTGTGQSIDGPYVHTGFLPRVLIYKRPGSGSWVYIAWQDGTISNTSYQNGRYNPIFQQLKIDSNGSRVQNQDVVFMANGFKIINNDSDSNLAGVTYPYLCWGNTAPFKLNNPM